MICQEKTTSLNSSKFNVQFDDAIISAQIFHTSNKKEFNSLDSNADLNVDLIQSYGVDRIAIISPDYKADNDLSNFYSTITVLTDMPELDGTPILFVIDKDKADQLNATLLFSDFVRDPSLDTSSGIAYTYRL